MSAIDKILEQIKPALEGLQKSNDAEATGSGDDVNGISTKISVDRDAGIIRIYTEKSDYIKRASSALSELLELAYTTAEHHPYWLLLYHAAETCKMVVDKWDSDLSADQLSEMSWRCDEIRNAIDRISSRR